MQTQANNQEPTFRDPNQAFELAIAQGALLLEESANDPASLYPGNWMYMGDFAGVSHFKNIAFRNYLKVVLP